MPKDAWKKAKDQDHVKRAKRELASDGMTSYPFVWDVGSGIERESQNDGSLSEQPSLASKVQHWLDWMEGSASTAHPARRALPNLRPHDAKTVHPLLRDFQSRSKYEQEHAVEILGRPGTTAVPSLIRAMQRGTSDEKYLAAVILSKIGVRALPPLRKLLDHEDDAVRTMAAISLGVMGERGAFELLWKAVKSQSTSVAESARRAFISSGRDCVDFLISLLDSEDTSGCVVALTLLGRIGPSAAHAVPVLLDIIRNCDDTRIRSAAKSAWTSIRSLKAIPKGDVRFW